MTAASEGWRPLRTPRRAESLTGEPSPFSRLALTHAVAAAGDAIMTLALAGTLFFDISPSAARGKVALSLLLTMAPFALVAPFLGPAIDRFSGGRRLMMLGAAAGRAAVCVGMAQVVDNLLLFPFAFAALVFSKTHGVAKSSLVSTTVEDEALLVEANAKLALISVVIGLVAAAPGIVILRLAGAEWALRLAAVVFVAAAVASLRIVQVRPADDPERRQAAARELHARTIVAAAVAMGTLRWTVGFLTFLVAFALRRDGAPAWWFGVTIGLSMGGTLLGSVLAPRLRERIHEEHIMTGALVLVSVAAAVAARYHTRLSAALLAGVVGLAASAAKLAFDSLVQRDAPDAAQGRSFARFEAAFQVVWVVGALIGLLAIPMWVGFVVVAVAPVSALVLFRGLLVVGHREARPQPSVEFGAGQPQPGGDDLGGGGEGRR